VNNGTVAAPELVRAMQAWKDSYPWLDRAFMEIGSAWATSNTWRARIEDDLKTTLDFKVRPDGTAAVWCGMSGYDFQHEPTPKELFEGLRDAYRREVERVGSSHATARSAPSERTKPRTLVRILPPPPMDSLTRRLGVGILLPRVIQLTLIFLTMAALTLVLSDVAVAVR
jgi:hypothetical protein